MGGGAVVAVGAVAVQGEGGGDRAQEGGGAGQGVLHAGPRGGGDQAPGLHPPGAGAHGRPHAPGGRRHPQADRQGQQAAQAALQDMPQKGTYVKNTGTQVFFFFIRFHFDQMARSQADSNTDPICICFRKHAGEGIQDVPRGLQREEQRESHAGQQANGG